MNGRTGEIVLEMGPKINERMSPCSTFKIPLSLLGFEAAVLKGETSPVWGFQEGYDDWLPSWRAAQNPQSWMKCSCIWYSKLLSFQLGIEAIQNFLSSIEYGNRDLSEGLIPPGPIAPFWINSTLAISPIEQVKFIQKMIRGDLPISFFPIQMTKSLLFKEELPHGWKLFGKTGWSGTKMDKSEWEHSWYVGWIEKGGDFYPFAYLIRGEKIDLDQRIPRVKALLLGSILAAS